MKNLEKLLKIRPVKFEYRQIVAPDGEVHVGVIAQEVQKYFPEMVSSDKINGEPYLCVDYSKLAVTALIELHRMTGGKNGNGSTNPGS